MCTELLAECVSVMHYQKETPQGDIDNVMVEILNMNDDLLCRVSHVEPGMKPKVFFNKLKNDLIERSNAIVEQISALL